MTLEEYKLYLKGNRQCGCPWLEPCTCVSDDWDVGYDIGTIQCCFIVVRRQRTKRNTWVWMIKKGTREAQLIFAAWSKVEVVHTKVYNYMAIIDDGSLSHKPTRVILSPDMYLLQAQDAKTIAGELAYYPPEFYTKTFTPEQFRPHELLNYKAGIKLNDFFDVSFDDEFEAQKSRFQSKYLPHRGLD